VMTSRRARRSRGYWPTERCTTAASSSSGASWPFSDPARAAASGVLCAKACRLSMVSTRWCRWRHSYRAAASASTPHGGVTRSEGPRYTSCRASSATSARWTVGQPDQFPADRRSAERCQTSRPRRQHAARDARLVRVIARHLERREAAARRRGRRRRRLRRLADTVHHERDGRDRRGLASQVPTTERDCGGAAFPRDGDLVVGDPALRADHQRDRARRRWQRVA